MLKPLTFDDFVQAFADAGRANQFSEEGIKALWDYLEKTDPKYELDVIDLCCGYTESTVADLARENDIDLTDCADDDERRAACYRYLDDRTTVIGKTKNGFVYQNF